MKRVNKIDGYRVTRPAKNHPNESHWQQLRETVRAAQGGNCATCWGDACDLHHRHYNNWGEELVEDVVFLCRQCHEAITSRIRNVRYAHGDMTIDERRVDVREPERFRPTPSYPTIEANTPTQKNGGGFHQWVNDPKRGI